MHREQFKCQQLMKSMMRHRIFHPNNSLNKFLLSKGSAPEASQGELELSKVQTNQQTITIGTV